MPKDLSSSGQGLFLVEAVDNAIRYIRSSTVKRVRAVINPHETEIALVSCHRLVCVHLHTYVGT